LQTIEKGIFISYQKLSRPVAIAFPVHPAVIFQSIDAGIDFLRLNFTYIGCCRKRSEGIVIRFLRVRPNEDPQSCTHHAMVVDQPDI
jgi:hypothetical protein